MDDNEQLISLKCFVQLLRSSEQLSNEVHKHLHQYGLTVSQFGVLEALYHLGPLSQKELAQKILKTSGNLTTVITNLERETLVTRKRSSDDRRYYSVQLTQKGEKLLDVIFPLHAKRIATQMKTLSQSEQITLGNLCKKLAGIL